MTLNDTIENARKSARLNSRTQSIIKTDKGEYIYGKLVGEVHVDALNGQSMYISAAEK